jgi:hypothetical protein
MTADEAKARLARLQTDKAWVARWSKGGATEAGEFRELTRTIAGAPATGKSMAQEQLDDLQKDRAWIARFRKGDPEAVAEFKSLTGAIAASEQP